MARMPAMAIKRHVLVEERTKALVQFAEESTLNTIEDNGSDIGIITAGISYQYAKEALGDKVNYLKLGMVFPLPEKKIAELRNECEMENELSSSKAADKWLYKMRSIQLGRAPEKCDNNTAIAVMI